MSWWGATAALIAAFLALGLLPEALCFSGTTGSVLRSSPGRWGARGELWGAGPVAGAGPLRQHRSVQVWAEGRSGAEWLAATGLALAVTCLGSMDAAEAFPNAMPEAAKFSDRPKKRGPEPKDIGLSVRSLNMEGDLSDGPVLKGCKSSPNCFSTSGDPQFDVPSLITPWKPPATQSKEATVAQLLKTIESYPPGQQGVDGGGFKVVKSKEGYIYTQFESLKNGYIDDVEFAVAEDGSEVQVRSSSRLGYLDFLVNAKRLNWFADALRADGWAAGAITSKSHPDYFQQNAQY